MKKIILLLFVISISFAQNANRKFISYSNSQVKVSDGTYEFKFLNKNIIETSFIPLGEIFNPISHAVINVESEKFDITGFDSDNEISIRYNQLEIKITKQPFKIAYYKNNQEIISEKLGYFKQKHTPLDNVKGNIIADSTEVIQFNITSDELFFGGGARVLGMNRRGNKLALYNKAQYGYENRAELMNYTLPVAISSKKYLLHFDNAPVGYLDLDSQKTNTLQYETISGRKTYQIIVGDSFDEVTSNFTLLTGRQPLPPRWVFGNFSSRFGYHSEAEARKTIQKFQEEKIPVDAIILDLYWFGKDIKGTMGNLEVYKDSFPNFEKMVSDFNKLGVKTITITEPFVLTTSKKWQEAVNNKVLATDDSGNVAKFDFYFGNTGIIDIFKPQAKQWFWNIYKDLANKGVSGVWGDLGEPEVFPSSANTFGGTADEVHNIYGHSWAKLIYEGYQSDFPNERPFILMRSGAAGSQRFGMIPWSGDVNRSWGGLSGQVEIALQMGMQGLGYMHSDLGGFAGANLDDQLYARWLQYGVFNPVFRPHAQEEVASEPVFRNEKAKKLAKKAIELRYQLLPYNYTLAFENSISGKPLMRPLFFEEENNTSLLSKADGYFWGNNFLIYPVLLKDQKEKEIYFPKSNNWFDFYTNIKYAAGTTKTFTLTEDYIPTFVRGGSFIPMIQTIQNTSTYNLKTFDLHFYFDDEVKITSGKLFHDDGLSSNNIATKKYDFITFRSKLLNQKLSIKIELDNEKGNSEIEKTILIIHNINKKPKSVTLNKKKLKFTIDKQGLLKIEVPLQVDTDKIIDIKL